MIYGIFFFSLYSMEFYLNKRNMETVCISNVEIISKHLKGFFHERHYVTIWRSFVATWRPSTPTFAVALALAWGFLRRRRSPHPTANLCHPTTPKTFYTPTQLSGGQTSTFCPARRPWGSVGGGGFGGGRLGGRGVAEKLLRAPATGCK